MDPCDSDIPEPHGGDGARPSTTPPQKDAISLVGGKKPPIPMDDDPSPPATSNAASGSGQLVYVRRRVEVDTSKAIGTATNPPKEPTTVSSSPQGPSRHSLDWEERYHHLQMLLNKLNDSDQTDHVQMLWSLSSAELSKHAVELEKRSIQFSLEEVFRRQELMLVKAKAKKGRSATMNKAERSTLFTRKKRCGT